MEETKGRDSTAAQEALGRPGRRAPSPVITLIASILELDRDRADLLAKAWYAALYRLDRGDAAQAGPDGDDAGGAPLGWRKEVLRPMIPSDTLEFHPGPPPRVAVTRDVHAYRDAIDPNCRIGTCSMNNCLYPDCLRKDA
jgi:hypothetical protein